MRLMPLMGTQTDPKYCVQTLVNSQKDEQGSEKRNKKIHSQTPNTGLVQSLHPLNTNSAAPKPHLFLFFFFFLSFLALSSIPAFNNADMNKDQERETKNSTAKHRPGAESSPFQNQQRGTKTFFFLSFQQQHCQPFSFFLSSNSIVINTCFQQCRQSLHTSKTNKQHQNHT